MHSGHFATVNMLIKVRLSAKVSILAVSSKALVRQRMVMKYWVLQRDLHDRITLSLRENSHKWNSYGVPSRKRHWFSRVSAQSG